MKTALITGITGQDGSYLAELLLQKGYLVHGLIRRSSSFNTERIDHLMSNTALTLHYGDMTDGAAMSHLISNRVFPDEVYNLAAQSHVMVSFALPSYTMDTGAMGNLRLLEAVREYKQNSVKGYGVRFYQASSSEMFGSTNPPQNEDSHFHPRSPYAVGKVAAYHMTTHYREAYGLFAVNGILFNHESERRGETFVTRKISRAVGRIHLGLQDRLYLGNVDARRDWGHARDYVKAMWMMVQADEPRDYVVATGESHSVGEFVEKAFGHVGLDWRKYVEIGTSGYERPTEVNHLQGDASRIKADLGWFPSVRFDALVKSMVDHDLELARRERKLLD